ncbi:MAG: hypothetical protein V3T42_04470 [Nitrospirales bacterium]
MNPVTIHDKTTPSESKLDILCYGTPLILTGLIWLTFWLSPDFFLSYVLEEKSREYQVVELMTFICAFIAGVILFYSTWQLWILNRLWAAVVVGIMALASIFFAGEEISWGQSYWDWATPRWWNQYVGYETNFHNSQISVWGFHQLAWVFLFGMFVVFPLAWKFRRYSGISLCLKPAVPEWPVVFSFMVALLYRELKILYTWWFPLDQFFQEFIWGINEHREMLVAVCLLFYALYSMQNVASLASLKTNR